MSENKGLVPEPSSDASANVAGLAARLAAFDWVAGLYGDRELTRDDVAAELADLRMIAAEVCKVYNHVTGGRISKPTTLASEVIAVSDDYFTSLVEDEVNDVLTIRDESAIWDLVMETAEASAAPRIDDNGKVDFTEVSIAAEKAVRAVLEALAKPGSAEESGTGRRENPSSSLPSKLEQPE